MIFTFDIRAIGTKPSKWTFNWVSNSVISFTHCLWPIILFKKEWSAFEFFQVFISAHIFNIKRFQFHIQIQILIYLINKSRVLVKSLNILFLNNFLIFGKLIIILQDMTILIHVPKQLFSIILIIFIVILWYKILHAFYLILHSDFFVIQLF